MAHGSRIINAPLPIENLKNMLIGQFGNCWVTPCPIYGLFYACNNILISSCGCTYHHFYMNVHLETKATVCANPLLEILSYANIMFATGMQLSIACNYLWFFMQLQWIFAPFLGVYATMVQL